MVYTTFGVVYAKGIQGFSQTISAECRHEGDRNAVRHV